MAAVEQMPDGPNSRSGLLLELWRRWLRFSRRFVRLFARSGLGVAQ
jgi:hypothetical protein